MVLEQGSASTRRRGRGRYRRLAAACGLVAAAAGTALPTTPSGAAPGELAVLGHTSLGGRGLNGEVTVLGDTAIVASGIMPGGGLRTHLYSPYPCPATKVQLVDISTPSAPQRVGQIRVRSGVSVRDVDAISVTTPHFTGDLLAVALARCGGLGNNEPRGIAYYDISAPAEPVLLGRYLADLELFSPGVKCDQEPAANFPDGTEPKGPLGCASSQDGVSLMQRPDGKVISISTEPFATASAFASGDIRIVDVTDPRNPVQIGDFDPAKDPRTPAIPLGFSRNGCRPFVGGYTAELYDSGQKALVAGFDDGTIDVSLQVPPGPAVFSTAAAATEIGRGDPYPAALPGDPAADREVEGNGAYNTFAGTSSAPLALLSDEDWIAPTTTVRIDTVGGSMTTASAQGLTPGTTAMACEAMFTLFDPENTAQVYRHAGAQVPAGAGNATDFVYIGRGCPGDALLGDAAGNPFSVAGKIVVTDRNRVAAVQGTQIPAAGCQTAAKALYAQQLGAVAVVVDGFQPGGNPFSFDGSPAGVNIPMVTMDRPAVTQLRNSLCPGVTAAGNGRCTPGTTATGAIVDSPGAWGGLHVIDLATHTEVGTYSAPTASVYPPPDLGVYSVHHAVAKGNRAFVASNSDGVRVLDLTNPAMPAEVGHFVPPDTPDPTNVLPAKAYVTGVAVAGCNVVVTDLNSGLYVLADPGLCP